MEKYCNLKALNKAYSNDTNSTDTIYNVLNNSIYDNNQTQSYANFYKQCSLYDTDFEHRIGYMNEKMHEPLHQYHAPEPNVALLSLILFLGTCAIALALKKLRRSNFFGSYVSVKRKYIKSRINFYKNFVLDSSYIKRCRYINCNFGNGFC